MQGEEGSSRKGSTGVTWVIDPLDGTINYLYGIPAFAVSIAASVGGRSIVGVVHNPLTGRDVHRLPGRGGVAGRRPATAPADRPAPRRGAGRYRFLLQRAKPGAQARMLAIILPAVRDIRRAGSAALTCAQWLADASTPTYEAELKPWDVAAGEVIARGGRGPVISLEGLPADPPTVVAAAPGLQGPLVELLDALGLELRSPQARRGPEARERH